MKTRLTAQAMHSFLLARCLASLSGSNVETVRWQSRRSSSSEALWLSPDAESQQVSGGEPLLKHRTAGFHTNKTHLKEFRTYHPRGSSSCCFSENSMSSGKSTSGAHVSLTKRTLPAGQCYLTEVEQTGTNNRLLSYHNSIIPYITQNGFYRNNSDND